MKYCIWRHENALGNAAEQVVNLSNYIFSHNDTEPVVYVESEFQFDFCRCIPNVKKENIHFYPSEIDLSDLRQSCKNFPDFFKDVYMPDVYFSDYNCYPSVWANLVGGRNILKFPNEEYNNLQIKEKSIVIAFREHGTYWKRVDGATCEPERFVNINTFFDIALYYANKGYTVYRIGDINQADMPNHENIVDVAKMKDRRMIDDLYLLANTKLFISCDSGVWPMAAGLRTNLILSNVTSAYRNMAIVNWLPKETSKYLMKAGRDNTFDEIINTAKTFLGDE